MALNNVKSVRLGNWLEELVLEEQTGVRFYPPPENKALSLMTKDRCITHTDSLASKEYVSTTKLTLSKPQSHPEYLVRQRSTVGPRQRYMEQKMRAEVEEDFKRTHDSTFAENRKVLYSSINASTYKKDDFTQSLVDDNPSLRIPTVATDYSSDPAITYYSQQIQKGSSLNFPVTFANSLQNPFQRSNAFSANVQDITSKRAESHERPQPFPKIDEARTLSTLRAKLLSSVSGDHQSPGQGVRRLLACVSTFADSLSEDFAPVDAVADVFQESFGVDFDENERSALVCGFSVDTTRKISLVGLYKFIRAAMNPRRLELVNMVYSSLARISRGASGITEEIVRGQFCPGVTQGRMDHLLMGLGFPSANRGLATLQDFLNYYATVSAEIDDNGVFEMLLKNSWGL